MTDGKLVTLEGIEAAGKGTQISRLRDEFPNAVFTREPVDGTWHGDMVREALSGERDVGEMGLLALYLLDHYEHMRKTVRPALTDGKTVFCDRYIDSRYVYQASVLGEYFDSGSTEALSWLETLHEHPSYTKIPDETIILDISAEESANRMGLMDAEPDKWEENIDHLETIRELYLELVERAESTEKEESRYTVIPGQLDEDTITDRIVAAISSDKR